MAVSGPLAGGHGDSPLSGTGVWQWPADDFQVVDLGDMFIVNASLSTRGEELLAFEGPPIQPLAQSPQLSYRVLRNEAALVARVHYTFCRFLGVPHAWVRAARHAESRGEPVAAVDAFYLMDVEELPDVAPIMRGLNHARMALSNPEDVVKLIVLDFAIGGVGSPRLSQVHNIAFHSARFPQHVPWAASPEHWRHLFATFPVFGWAGAQVAEFAARVQAQLPHIRSVVAHDEAWLAATPDRGAALRLADLMCGSLRALQRAVSQPDGTPA